MKKNSYYSEYRFGQENKSKKSHIVKNILLILVLTFLIAMVSIGIQIIIQRSVNEDIEIWLSALPSYWGGIVGGAISGTISVIGVYLTIKYYRDSDATKSRIEHMPFIHMRMIKAERIKFPDVSKAKIIEVPNRNYIIDKNNLWILDLELENIGNGFANTLVLHIGTHIGGEAYHRLLKVGETDHLQLKFYLDDVQHSSLEFGLQFIDSMTNEYLQTYTISYTKQSIVIESGYPFFIGQTHFIGH